MLRPFEQPSSPLPTPVYSPWKPYRALVLVLVFHLIGTTWLKHVAWKGVAPDLALCCALCLALLGGFEVGAWAGGIAGVLLMWTGWQSPGSLLFSSVLPPVLIGLFASRLPATNPLLPPLVGALGAVISDAAFVLLSPRAMPLNYWTEHVVHFALVQAVAMWPVMICVARVAKARHRLLFD